MFFNEQGMLNLDEAVMNQPTFKKIMEDGIVTEQEVKEQSERIISILKSMEKSTRIGPFRKQRIYICILCRTYRLLFLSAALVATTGAEE